LQFIEKLQSEKKYEKLGAVGYVAYLVATSFVQTFRRYCFGGAMCIRFGNSGLLKTIVICHPGSFSQKDLEAISVRIPVFED